MASESQTADLEDFGASETRDIGEDRRKSDRQITVFRLAKIQSGVAEGWGFIKNISNDGVMIEIHPGFKLDDTAKVVLTDNLELVGKVRWRKGALVGMQFSSGINVSELLATLTVRNKYQPARLPRVRMTRPVFLRIGSTLARGEICDISPAGARINTRCACQIGNRLILSVPELGEIAGTVRWQKGPEIGIKFQERVSVPQITDWLGNYYTNGTITNNEMSETGG
ncbi:PilZ domain-containing protein [Parasphingorhabdus cellanae]|uniref:PilZ domain-containing protein n=1 Tax=Parasphingorhabdus cellanae TaxID=2806553 RepID=A0ABX7T5Q4_9SPHN|nr:PilZ domain-containing protein [Parasphingorhabdus cellanae]QTD56929.1 PilZ domain-containing protein [Parasphingorhabdus cellanae]